jgi:hypothetical protein
MWNLAGYRLERSFTYAYDAKLERAAPELTTSEGSGRDQPVEGDETADTDVDDFMR